jgi:acyl-CoA dehydrogenase
MWYLTDERKLLQEMVRDFSEKEIRPFVDEMEKNSAYPKEILKKLGEMGIFGLNLEEKYGGSGVDWVSMALVMEEMAKVSSTAALLAYLASEMTSHTMADACTPDQVERIIKPAVKGDILLGLWTTEPCGIFNLAEYETTAVLEGDEWVINGGKIFATNAGVADYSFVYCRTKEDADVATMDGWSCICVPTDTPGVEIGHIENKIGWKGTQTGQVYFNDVRVRKDNLIGEKDKAFPYLISKLFPGYLFYGAWSVGAAEAVFEKTKDYLKQRTQGGVSLWDAHQVIRNDMANLWADISLLKNAVYSVAENMNRGINSVRETIMLKAKGNKIAEHVISECIVLNGGVGTVYETDIERYLRDVKMHYVGCGSDKTLIDMLSTML